MVGAAVFAGDDVVYGEVVVEEVHPASVAPASLLPEQVSLMRPVGRQVAEVGANYRPHIFGIVRVGTPVDDIVEQAEMLFQSELHQLRRLL